MQPTAVRCSFIILLFIHSSCVLASSTSSESDSSEEMVNWTTTITGPVCGPYAACSAMRLLGSDCAPKDLVSARYIGSCEGSSGDEIVGLAGGSFSVGTPYVARWFPKTKQGFAMGVYGAGNSGAAVNKFVAPVLIVAFGWTIVPQVYAAVMLGAAILFWLFSYHNPSHVVSNKLTFSEQLKTLKDPKVLRYCQYYSIVFGGYVALSLWMVQYYVGEFGLDIRVAALLAACFSLPGGVLRAIGGWLSDKFGAHQVTWWVMWVSWICLFLLSYPQTDFTIFTTTGPQTFHIGLNVYAFTGLMFI